VSIDRDTDVLKTAKKHEDGAPRQVSTSTHIVPNNTVTAIIASPERHATVATDIDSAVLFGSFDQPLDVTRGATGHGSTSPNDTNMQLLEAVRTEASKGPYQIRVFFIRAPPMPEGHFGTWKGKCMVFFELWNRMKGETHWAYRPDLFGRILALARSHSSNVPKILLSVLAMPKRSITDPYTQATRQIRLRNGNTWAVNETILGFATSNDKTDDEIKTTVFSHLDALAQPEMRSLYFEQRKNNSTDRLKAEIDPNSGPFWTTLRSARADTQIQELQNLDMVVTTGAAFEVVRRMFNLSGGPDEWKNPPIVSFATAMY
jgi:hypothetical protein